MESSTNSILETTGITSSTNSIHETTEVTLTEADITTYFDIVTVSTILPEITTKGELLNNVYLNRIINLLKQAD